MVHEKSDTAMASRSSEELRQEFRMAQRRRLVRRGIALWHEDDVDESHPESTTGSPPDEVD